MFHRAASAAARRSRDQAVVAEVGHFDGQPWQQIRAALPGSSSAGPFTAPPPSSPSPGANKHHSKHSGRAQAQPSCVTQRPPPLRCPKRKELMMKVRGARGWDVKRSSAETYLLPMGSGVACSSSGTAPPGSRSNRPLLTRYRQLRVAPPSSNGDPRESNRHGSPHTLAPSLD